MSKINSGIQQMAAAFFMLFFGCEKAPEQELTTAKAALDSVRVSETYKCPDSEYLAAQELLNAAIEGIERKKLYVIIPNYDREKALLASVTTMAKNARLNAQEEKRMLREELNTMLTKEMSLVKELKDLLEKARKGMNSEADIENISVKISTIELALIEAQTLPANGELVDAHSEINAGIAKLDSVKLILYSMIDSTRIAGVKQ